jgi:hypothetical protein
MMRSFMHACILLSVLLALLNGLTGAGEESSSANSKIMAESVSFIAPSIEKENPNVKSEDIPNQSSFAQRLDERIWPILGPLAFMSDLGIGDNANSFAAYGGIAIYNLNRYIDDLLNVDSDSKKEPDAQSHKVHKRLNGHCACPSLLACL